jgi:hypothetical protein
MHFKNIEIHGVIFLKGITIYDAFLDPSKNGLAL